MGAWGINNFENDDASDWLGEFCDEPNEEALNEAFASVNEIGNDYLEAPESSIALVAAEIVATLKNSPSLDLPEATKNCLNKINFKMSNRVISDSLKAVERVKLNSELKELWEESDDFTEWNTIVNNLIDRLKI